MDTLDETRRILGEAFSQTWQQWRTQTRQGIFSADIAAVENDIGGIYKKVALPTEMPYSKYQI
jgi:hypothetical protein